MTDMIRVGVRPDPEVYVKPDGTVQPAMLAVIWTANRLCNERGIEPIFGEPKLVSDSFREIEEYEHARVIHTKDKADGTVRIVGNTDLGREILNEAWEQIRSRVVMARYAKQAFPEANAQQLASYS